MRMQKLYNIKICIVKEAKYMNKKQYVTMWLNCVEYTENDVIRTSADVEVDATQFYGDDVWTEE